MFAVHVPVVTTVAAGLLGLLFVILSGLVVTSRLNAKVTIGTGEATPDPEANKLLVAVRAHANFAEYTPLTLGLIALMEMRTGPTGTVKFLALALVLARAAHAIGMNLKAPNAFRAGGFMGTLLVLLAASIAAIFSFLM